jgi:membrane-bound serine protease (ClpP class)
VLRSPEPEADQGEARPAAKPLPPASHIQVEVGDQGVAESTLRPAGRAIFGDQYLNVVTDGSFVERGRQVRIIEIGGNRIVVREAEPPQEDS